MRCLAEELSAHGMLGFYSDPCASDQTRKGRCSTLLLHVFVL